MCDQTDNELAEQIKGWQGDGSAYVHCADLQKTLVNNNFTFRNTR